MRRAIECGRDGSSIAREFFETPGKCASAGIHHGRLVREQCSRIHSAASSCCRYASPQSRRHIQDVLTVTTAERTATHARVDALAVAKRSFNKQAGQHGFDPRADFDGNGAMDIKDWTLMTQIVPVPSC